MLKSKSKKVWVSYGIMRALCPFLHGDEQVRMQILNRFSYRVLVSRIQATIPLALDGLIFSLGLYDDDKKSTLYFYDESTEVCQELKYENVDLSNSEIIQAKNEIYAFEIVAPKRFFVVKPNRRTAKVKFLQGLITPRTQISICNFDDRFIFAIGGWNEFDKTVSEIVEFYDIINDTWTDAPSLNGPR